MHVMFMLHVTFQIHFTGGTIVHPRIPANTRTLFMGVLRNDGCTVLVQAPPKVTMVVTAEVSWLSPDMMIESWRLSSGPSRDQYLPLGP